MAMNILTLLTITIKIYKKNGVQIQNLKFKNYHNN